MWDLSTQFCDADVGVVHLWNLRCNSWKYFQLWARKSWVMKNTGSKILPQLSLFCTQKIKMKYRKFWLFFHQLSNCTITLPATLCLWQIIKKIFTTIKNLNILRLVTIFPITSLCEYSFTNICRMASLDISSTCSTTITIIYWSVSKFGSCWPDNSVPSLPLPIWITRVITWKILKFLITFLFSYWKIQIHIFKNCRYISF